jgi:hypothetical protein
VVYTIGALNVGLEEDDMNVMHGMHSTEMICQLIHHNFPIDGRGDGI